MKRTKYVLILMVILLWGCKERPVADFTPSKTEANIGDTITFTNQSTNAIKYIWDFDDRQQSTVENPTYTYWHYGEYDVSLEAFSEKLNTRSDYKSVTITINEPEKDTLTDARDGQMYNTIKIGNQWWMAENLNYETDSGSWVLYSRYGRIIGRLYDWKTACTACPNGWHLPAENEWTTLINYLGGEEVAGNMLRNWDWIYSIDGDDQDHFWSTSEANDSLAWSCWLVEYWDYYQSDIYQAKYYSGNSPKSVVYSVRCVKD